jgi:transposase-like protein
MEVLNELDPGASLQNVINQYDVSRSTLYDIKQNRKRTLEFVLKEDNSCSDPAEKHTNQNKLIFLNWQLLKKGSAP